MKIPPLSAIRAFEAAARHQSFTRAAEELGMTQAAVSYQIRVLEDRVGMPLFFREPRQVTLTSTGKRLSPRVTEALELLGAAFADLTHTSKFSLTLAVLPTIASAWLAPRLHVFQSLNPDLAINVRTYSDQIDFSKGDVDAIIRGDDGDWAGHEVIPLFPMEYAPVCTPEFREANGLGKPSDLLSLRRFGAPRWWDRWFREMGVEQSKKRQAMGLVLGVQATDVALTLMGQGIAMVVPAFFGDELASGRLIQPFEHVVHDGRCYALIYPKTRTQSKKIRLFRDWVAQEAGVVRA